MYWRYWVRVGNWVEGMRGGGGGVGGEDWIGNG